MSNKSLTLSSVVHNEKGRVSLWVMVSDFNKVLDMVLEWNSQYDCVVNVGGELTDEQREQLTTVGAKCEWQ